MVEEKGSSMQKAFKYHEMTKVCLICVRLVAIEKSKISRVDSITVSKIQ